MTSEVLLRVVSFALLVSATGVGAPVAAQDPSGGNRLQTPERHASYAVTLGLGNVLGWVGAGAERFFSRGRMSALVGAGYLWETDAGNPGRTAFGAALRSYLGSGAHRGVVELSVSLVAHDWLSVNGVVVEDRKHYGPGLAIGYRFTAAGGIHFDFGLGGGWAVGNGSLHPIGTLAVGYTWRR